MTQTLQLIDPTKGINVLKVTIEMISSKTQKVTCLLIFQPHWHTEKLQ